MCIRDRCWRRRNFTAFRHVTQLVEVSITFPAASEHMANKFYKKPFWFGCLSVVCAGVHAFVCVTQHWSSWNYTALSDTHCIPLSFVWITPFYVVDLLPYLYMRVTLENEMNLIKQNTSFCPITHFLTWFLTLPSLSSKKLHLSCSYFTLILPWNH